MVARQNVARDRMVDVAESIAPQAMARHCRVTDLGAAEAPSAGSVRCCVLLMSVLGVPK